MDETLLSWHFVKADKRLGYKSGREVRAGQRLRVKGKLELCKWGLHASIRPIDALEYAPGLILCRVECSGEIIRGHDKIVARRRKVLWMSDAEPTIYEWACWCAEEATRKYDSNPDPRSLAAIAAKRAWLRGEISDADLAAARAAAWAAVRVAARDAAWDAAKAAAWDAARAAAWAAARVAAKDAAWDASWAAARAAAWAAVWDASWAAARAAAWDEQNSELETRLLALAPKGS